MVRAFDRVLLARHFALSLGALIAYVFRAELLIGYLALSIVGVSATLNFLAYFFGTRPSMTRICMTASPIIGVGGWTALMAVTQGVASPFIAGLWLEIVLSAMGLQLRNVVVVTVGAIAGLWLQQARLGIDAVVLEIVVQSGFIAGAGLATVLVTRRWIQRQTSILERSEQLGQRLQGLAQELEDERTVAALGEKVARLAHGIKNAVHSLRGFARLIETRVGDRSHADPALQGLYSAIEDLESLARTTLDSAEGNAGRSSGPREAKAPPLERDGGVLPPAVQRALNDIQIAHPRVRWEVESDGRSPDAEFAESSLCETLTILLRNAVEAMDGEGQGLIESRVVDGMLTLAISDQGKGLTAEELAEVFKPGFTTKKKGSGYGLFLARRIVEEHGGTLSAHSRPEGGAVFQIALPVAE